jgi:hypothetical protein
MPRPRSPKPAAPRAAPKKKTRAPTTAPAGLESALAALREEVASLRRDVCQIPRAKDFEPLVGPLREFTQVSPVLAETLASVVKAVTPLPRLIEPLLGVARGRNGPELAEAAARVSAARAAIGEALATLPRDKTYAGAAAHLRELATVSPSLMEWMKQLPALSMPLAESIAALEEAARELVEAERGLRHLLHPGA